MADEPETSSTGATVSARILRKREVDRKCQQVIRARRRSRIEYLESLVEQLERTDTNGKVDILLRQLYDVVAVRDTLMRKIKAVESIVNIGTQSVVSAQETWSNVDSDSVSTATDLFSNTLQVNDRSPSASNEYRHVRFHDSLIIRAMVEGWDTIKCYANLHPVWHLLQFLDENYLCRTGSHERLVTLITLWSFIEAVLQPDIESFRKPHMTFLELPARDLIHLCTNKGMEQSYTRTTSFYPHGRYWSSQFWCLFCENFVFLWPYEFRDCYVRDTVHGSYSISETFLNHFNDPRYWKIGQGLFQVYPELQGVNTAWDTVPVTTTSMDRNQVGAIESMPHCALLEEYCDRTEKTQDIGHQDFRSYSFPSSQSLNVDGRYPASGPCFVHPYHSRA